MYNTKDEMIKALKKTGIRKNDTVFFTTSIGMLGMPNIPNIKGSHNINNISKFILDIIKEVLGPKGTVLVPTYSYSFGKLLNNRLPVFNIKKTPSKIGPFGNFFMKQKGVVRSQDPMISISGFGPNAKKILQNRYYFITCIGWSSCWV